MVVTTRRQGALPPATAGATRSQTSRCAHGQTRIAVVVPEGIGRNRGHAAAPTVGKGTARQRRNDSMDEGGNQEYERRRDVEQDHDTHLERISAELTANRAIILALEAQVAEVAEDEERRILAYDQEIKDLEDERNDILLKVAELRERRRRIVEARQELRSALVQGQMFQVDFDHLRVQRGEPGGVEPQVAPLTIRTAQGLPQIHTAPALEDPPESWYQHTPHLTRRAARLLYWGLDQKPLESHSTAYRSYLQACASQGYPHPFPATLHSLAGWVGALADNGMLYQTIKSYLVDARSAQDEMGASREELEMFSHPTLERILDGIRNLQYEVDG